MPINTVSLAVESTTVPVSKELLGVSSEFFSSLFYGDFMEKNSGSYSIKEVDENACKWMINSLMERKWNVPTVDHALSALHIADRFCMYNVHKRIVPFLKAIELNSNAEIRLADLKSYIDIAARCRDNGEFVCWIFEKCQTSLELIAIAQSCGQALNPHLAVFLQYLTKKIAEETNQWMKEKEELNKIANTPKNPCCSHCSRTLSCLQQEVYCTNCFYG